MPAEFPVCANGIALTSPHRKAKETRVCLAGMSGGVVKGAGIVVQIYQGPTNGLGTNGVGKKTT